jgi:P pilus assembly chaperone PapD
LKAVNSGPLHAQLSAVKLTLADGSTLKVADGLLGYALPGCAREWRLPTGGPTAAPTAAPTAGQFGREPHVLAAVNGRVIDAPVALASTGSAH